MTVFAAVWHAEVVAHRVGETFGTLVLALAVTVIEQNGENSQEGGICTARLRLVWRFLLDHAMPSAQLCNRC
jgi:hypothetical protein